MALRKFEGLIATAPPPKSPNPSTYVWTPRTPSSHTTTTTPTSSAPNVIDLFITIPDEEDVPTTSKPHTEVATVPHITSHKGKELMRPMAVIDTVSTAETVESDDSILERQIAIAEGKDRKKASEKGTTPPRTYWQTLGIPKNSSQANVHRLFNTTALPPGPKKIITTA
jgi:hypothetical protein